MERRDANGRLPYIIDDVTYWFEYVLDFVGELANIFLVYYAQLGAVVLVLFWLLKALYSTAWPIVQVV